MTEQELLFLQLAKIYPEDERLWQDSYDKYGMVGTLALFRRKNADRNRGELNCQFIEWILEKEEEYFKKIKGCLADSDMGLKLGNQKVKFTYYGFIYVILKWEGCYVRGKGKRNAPNEISYSKFCCKELLNLQDRLNSNNVRKTLANPVYSHNYLLDFAFQKPNEGNNHLPKPMKKLEPVFKELLHDVENYINSHC